MFFRKRKALGSHNSNYIDFGEYYTTKELLLGIWYKPRTIFRYMIATKYNENLPVLISLPPFIFMMLLMIRDFEWAYLLFIPASLFPILICWIFWSIFSAFFRKFLTVFQVEIDFDELLVLILHASLPYLAFIAGWPLLLDFTDDKFPIPDNFFLAFKLVHWCLVLWSFVLIVIAIQEKTKVAYWRIILALFSTIFIPVLAVKMVILGNK